MTTTARVPLAFISYSWDSPVHQDWTKKLAAQLRGHGVQVTLDCWATAHGDQLPKFMETAIRDNDYVLIVCTPQYKAKSDTRKGGVGYEGDIMTGEVHTEGNHRKFIPILRAGTKETAIPSWLKGKFYADLSGDPYSAEQYQDLLLTLHGRREQPPPLGPMPVLPKTVREEVKQFDPTKESASAAFEPVKIEGVLLDEVGKPKDDGSRGSALYAVPFKLNRRPSNEWGHLFIQAWDRPPSFNSMHRPGIAHVQGDRIVLKGTTLEEVRDHHRNTLKLAVDVANREAAELAAKRRAAEEADATRERERRDNIRKIGEDLKFD